MCAFCVLSALCTVSVYSSGLCFRLSLVKDWTECNWIEPYWLKRIDFYIPESTIRTKHIFPKLFSLFLEVRNTGKKDCKSKTANFQTPALSKHGDTYLESHYPGGWRKQTASLRSAWINTIRPWLKQNTLASQYLPCHSDCPNLLTPNLLALQNPPWSKAVFTLPQNNLPSFCTHTHTHTVDVWFKF